MPQGFKAVAEAVLPQAERLLAAEVRQELRSWWLAVSSSHSQTPNFDLASTCTIDGRPGLLLVEAKAHELELTKEEAGKPLKASFSENSRRNEEQIGRVIAYASTALTEATGLAWSLSKDHHYQMSNRFAWAWKLTSLGLPVVLIYLGFLNCSEMRDMSPPFASAADWEKAVLCHSLPLFPAGVWGQSWLCNGQPLIPLIRSLDVCLTNGVQV